MLLPDQLGVEVDVERRDDLRCSEEVQWSRTRRLERRLRSQGEGQRRRRRRRGSGGGQAGRTGFQAAIRAAGHASWPCRPPFLTSSAQAAVVITQRLTYPRVTVGRLRQISAGSIWRRRVGAGVWLMRPEELQGKQG